MVVIYTSVLVSLWLLKSYCSWRSSKFYKKFEAAHKECNQALTPQKEGNSRQLDPISEARLRTKLDRNVERMTQLEERFDSWESRRVGLQSVMEAFSRWRGRVCPY